MGSALLNLSRESIDFQGTAFFDELVAAVRDLRGFGAGLSVKAYYETDKIKKFGKIIKDYTNMNIFISEDSAGCGPCIENLLVNNNHVFWDKQTMAFLAAIGEQALYESEMAKVLEGMKTKITKGSVDIVKGKVYGVFAELTRQMQMPRDMFYGAYYEPEEVASIMMHEVGHPFTQMEFMNRMVSTNQVLAGLTRAMDRSTPGSIKEAVFTEAIALTKMNKEQAEALRAAKSSKEMAVIVLGKAIEECTSELGESVFDINGCELLADQFCNRMGAGRYLVSALHKADVDWGTGALRSNWFITMWTWIGHVFLANLTWGFWLVLVCLLQSKEGNYHEESWGRFARIKNDNIQALKNQNLPPAMRKMYLDNIDTITGIMDKYNKEDMDSFKRIAYFLNPTFRRKHKFEVLQKDIEYFASNDLFAAAARMKT